MSAAHDEELVKELRHTVRMFMGIVNNLPPFVSAMALLESESPNLTEEERVKSVSKAHTRLSALMREAYRLTEGAGAFSE